MRLNQALSVLSLSLVFFWFVLGCVIFMLFCVLSLGQWRRQLVGTWARAPPGVWDFFSARLYIVLFGLVLCQTLNLAPFVQPYSLWNNTITGYNGASAKVNIVFTPRRYALARSLLSAGVCPSVRHVRVCIQMAEDIIKHVFRPGSAIILVFFDPKRQSVNHQSYFICQHEELHTTILLT